MIGILGGTFDPPHLAHLKISEYLLDALLLEKIIFIPCYLPVLKKYPHANPENRLAMVNLMIKGNPKLELDHREIKNAQPSYTIDTLKSIRQEIGHNTPLAFIIGSDAFNQFLHWKDWQGILKLCQIVVVNRPGYELNKKIINSCGAQVLVCEGIEMNISSTEVREGLAKKSLRAKEKLPEAVWDYILEHSLYRKTSRPADKPRDDGTLLRRNLT